MRLQCNECGSIFDDSEHNDCPLCGSQWAEKTYQDAVLTFPPEKELNFSDEYPEEE